VEEKISKKEIESYINGTNEINPNEECLLMKLILDKYEKGRSRAFDSNIVASSHHPNKKMNKFSTIWAREKTLIKSGISEESQRVQLLEQHVKKSFAQIQKTKVSKI
jgi:hypothetical protein